MRRDYPHLSAYLEAVRARPGMHVPASTPLRSLEDLLFGYGIGSRAHGGGDAAVFAGASGEFSQWLFDRVEPSSLGWAHRLTEVAREWGAEPIDVFFEYWDAFVNGDDAPG